jgi:hypothetical protein
VAADASSERPAAPTDAELWRCVESTVLDVLLPALPENEEWARVVAVQLVGLVRYAASRPADPTADRVVEIAATLHALSANEIVAAVWDGDRSDHAVMTAAGAALAGAVGRNDEAAAEVRSVLRPVIVRHLDDDLAVTAPLVGAFRGRLDG